MLQIYNTLGQRKEKFIPLQKNKVGLYSCGPTVYNYAHLGNLRAYVFADILRRTLEYNHYQVKHIINITDIGHLTSDADVGEDKMVKALQREGKKLTAEAMQQIATFYSQSFFQNINDLNILPANKYPLASQHVPAMIKMIQAIEKNGYSYETTSALYFNTQKFKNYGQLLAKKSKNSEKNQARIKINPEKKNPSDFILWFKAQGEKRKHILQWDSPWGEGWPGWHIECAAMSTQYLGQPFDLHTGGIDHIPVHHTNEIAQAEAAYQKPLARYWLHNEFLVLDQGKMSKSKEGFITLDTIIEKKFHPLSYRYLCLNTHYRSPLSFSWESMKSAQNALFKLYQLSASLPKSSSKKIIKKIEDDFQKSINNDLNTPQALALAWSLLKNKEFSPQQKIDTLIKMDQVLGLNIEKNRENISKIPLIIKNLSKKRETLRKEKKWEEADQIRQQIEKAGFTVEDSPQGPLLKKKN
jgi:cysteinyl-tRNA synthetase